MSDDTYDRLKAAHDLAFDAKQAAYQRLAPLRREWTAFRDGGKLARLRQLATEADRLSAAWDAAKANSQLAWQAGAKAMAKTYSDEIAQYRATLPGIRSELKTLRDERRRIYEPYDRAQTEFSAARDRFNDARQQLKDYIEQAQANRQTLRTNVLYEAGIDPNLAGAARIAQNPQDGSFQVYYGGDYGNLGGADGHGHKAVRLDGTTKYDRRPGEAHGRHNFTDQPAKPRPTPKPTPPRQQPEPPRDSARPSGERSRPAAPIGSKWEPSRDREERIRREQAQQASREAARLAEDKKRREADTPRIAAQTAAQAAAEAAATQQARTTMDNLLGEGMYDDLMAELARRQAAREAAARGQDVPTASSQPPSPTRQAAPSPDLPTAEDRRGTSHFRPTPDADPSPPARVGSGKKWEPEADRIRREKREEAERRGLGADHKWSRPDTSGLDLSPEGIQRLYDETKDEARKADLASIMKELASARAMQVAARENLQRPSHQNDRDQAIYEQQLKEQLQKERNLLDRLTFDPE